MTLAVELDSLDPACSEHLPVSALLENDSVPVQRTADGVLVATALPAADRWRLDAWFPGENLMFSPVGQAAVLDLIILLREDEIADEMANGFAQRFPELAARTGVARWQKRAAIALVLAVGAAPLAGGWGATAVIVLIGASFCACVLFKLVLATSSKGHRAIKSRYSQLADEDLPCYTIIVPAYHEEEVIGPTIQWIANVGFIQLAEAVLREMAPPIASPDLLILAYALPDLHPLKSTTTYLNYLLGGESRSFAAAEDMTMLAARLLGPASLIEHPWLEKTCRDVRAFDIMEGPANLHRLAVFQGLRKATNLPGGGNVARH